jgi:GT2 family glycosyltransferase
MQPFLEQQRPAASAAGGPDALRGGTATVAVCAYTLRRWDDLTAAVGSVVRQLRPGDECVVVTDHNEELRARAEARFDGEPSVRVVANTGPRGLSGARNTAIATARGDVVAFLDDDALASDQWLPGMLAVLAETDVLGVGCAALPRWPLGCRPPWFPPEFDWVVGCSYGGLPTARADVRNVIGAAMAFRREAFELAGAFSTHMGRVGTAPTGCEETELCIRVRRVLPAARLVYLPDVSVTHRVTEDRLRPRYVLRRCLGEGRSKAWVSRLQGAGPGLATERDYVRRVLPLALLRELRRGLRGDGSGLSAALLIVAGVLAAALGFVHARLTRGGLHGRA